MKVKDSDVGAIVRVPTRSRPQHSSTRPDQASVDKKDVIVIIFVVVVQDGLPPRGGVLPARAGECCVFFTSTTDHLPVVVISLAVV